VGSETRDKKRLVSLRWIVDESVWKCIDVMWLLDVGCWSGLCKGAKAGLPLAYGLHTGKLVPD
jgi:hypothetical protein